MKGIRENPALDAYQRMAVTPVTAARPVPSADSEAEPAAPTVAHVNISSKARDLALGAKEAQIDVQKVEALKTQIADQTFKVNPEQIAKGLLSVTG